METKNKIIKYIGDNNLIEQGDRILLSLSAGKDSICMFNMLMEFSKEIKFDIGIFHLNHLLRGGDSDRDEELIRDIADSTNIKLHSYSFDFTKNRIDGISFEEQARNKRYSLLAEVCSKYGYNKIATAHTMSDNAETVFMRIMNGTGIYGLRGIVPKRDNIIRPIMCLTKNEVYEYLETKKLGWREDLSNQDNKYLRNHIRNRVFPVIEKRFSTYEKSLNDLADLADQNNRLLDELINYRFPSVVSEKKGVVFIDITNFKNNYDIQNHLIARSVRNTFGLNVTSGMLREINRNEDSIKANVHLYSNSDLEVDRINFNQKSHIRIRKSHTVSGISDWGYEISTEGDSVYLSEIDASIMIKRVDYLKFQKYRNSDLIFFVTTAGERFPFLIRNRRNGDRISLESGTKKIKNLLIEKKLDNETKNWVPLLLLDSKIVAFMPGIVLNMSGRVSSEFKVKDDSDFIYAVFNPDKFDLSLLVS